MRWYALRIGSVYQPARAPYGARSPDAAHDEEVWRANAHGTCGAGASASVKLPQREHDCPGSGSASGAE